MNCIAWNIGHLAWQEQRYWLWRGQDQILLPELNELFAYGAPASTPSLEAIWTAWRTITTATDPWLGSYTPKSVPKKEVKIVTLKEAIKL
jgi:hypothetical protein